MENDNTSETRAELKMQWMKKRINGELSWIEDCNAWQLLEAHAAAERDRIKLLGRREAI